MRKGLLLLFATAVILTAAGCGGRERSGSVKDSVARQPDFNVLLITIDTLRFDRLGIYSDKYVKTPNIDNFAGDSFRFTRGFAHNPVTFPSHTNILTGTTPLYHGISDNSGFVLENRFQTLAELLKKHHFDTGAFVGAFPLDSRFGLNQGFDVYDDNYGTHNDMDMFFVERKAEQVIKPAVEWLRERNTQWFCWIHLFDPHQPYMPPAPFNTEYADDLYSGEVAYTDRALGDLFTFLRSEGIYEKTIIILTGDHGEALGEKGEKTHSYFAYNNTIHVPLIIRIPGTEGATIRKNAAHIDIFPTVCDLLGIDIPPEVQGESLRDVIAGGDKKETYIYFESLTPFLNRGWAPLRGFVRGNDKFIDQPLREFYDLAEDMQEDKNLISQKNSGNLKYELDKLISRFDNKQKTQRAGELDPETQKRLKSLGYFSDLSVSKKKVFTEKDDLKTLLPLQNKMLDALALHQKGRSEEAIRMLKEILTESPTYTLIYSHLAKIYKESNRTALSVSILEQGLKNIPGEPFLLSKLGIFLVENGEFERGVKVLEESILLLRNDPESFNYLGVAYYRSGNFERAMQNYNRALELDNNYASVYNNIGSLFLSKFQRTKNRTDYDSSIHNFNKALEIDGNLYSALNGRGAARYFTGDYSGAISDWKKSISAKPDFIDPYFSIGIAYMVKLGDKRSANEYFKLCRDRFYNKLPENQKNRLDRLIYESGN